MLKDLVVLDLSRALAGPHAGMTLGDLGARVIKVESLDGDDSRRWGPPFVEHDGDLHSTYFMAANRNKESVVADLKSPQGVELLTRLIRHSDVLLENFRSGVLDRLGFSVERMHEINPRLIIARITGFGHDGPEANRPGYDQIGQGEGGLMSLTRTPDGEPMRTGVPIADLLAGMNAVIAVLAALHERDRTGVGQEVHTSLLASMVGVHAFHGTAWTVAGQQLAPAGNHHASIAPYGLFFSADSPVQVAVASQGQWRSFATMLDLDPDDPQFRTNADRVVNRDHLVEVINAAFATRTSDELLQRLAEAHIPAGKVRSISEVYAWEQTRSQGLLIDVEHSALGALNLPGSPIRFGRNEFAGAREHHTAPPMLGEHNDSVAAWLDERDAATE